MPVVEFTARFNLETKFLAAAELQEAIQPMHGPGVARAALKL